MNGVIQLKLNNFLFNSGVVGLMYLLDNSQIPYIHEGNSLILNSDIINDFDKYYFSALKEKYGDETVCKRLISCINNVNGYNLNDNEDLKRLDESVKFIDKMLNRGSYKSAYEIIKERGGNTEAIELIAEAKKSKSPEQKIYYLREIQKYLVSYEEVLLMKDIIYTKIFQFWQSVSFLNSNNSKKEISPCYREHFIEPALKYLSSKPKGKMGCLECGSKISKNDAFAMSWLNDVGVDVNRKKSYFWNYKPDSYICPICNLVYSCVPLGFTINGMDGIFVNCNDNISTIYSINLALKDTMISESETRDKVYYEIARKFSFSGDQRQASDEIGNIQVVRRKVLDKDNQKYYFNMLSKRHLNILLKNSKEMEILSKITVKIGEDYLNMYDEVIKRLFGNSSLYTLVHEVLRNSLSENAKVSFLIHVLKLQISYFKDGVDEMNSENTLEKLAYSMRKDGQALKKEFIDDGQEKTADNKLRSFAYQLLNALNTRNPSKFMDIVLRMYIGIGKDVPTKFGKMLTDEDYFLALGYAFIIGLKGEIFEKKQEGVEVQ